eukprot:8689519-Pyramimonas_sp.AAC.1
MALGMSVGRRRDTSLRRPASRPGFWARGRPACNWNVFFLAAGVAGTASAARWPRASLTLG